MKSVQVFYRTGEGWLTFAKAWGYDCSRGKEEPLIITLRNETTHIILEKTHFMKWEVLNSLDRSIPLYSGGWGEAWSQS